MRHHVAALYAFARRADDIADEGEWSPQQRLSRLDDWGGRLRAAVGRTPLPEVGDVDDDDVNDDDAELIFTAVAATVRRFDLPVTLLEDLLSAFRQDVTVNRYRRWEDLLDYSRRSANPVGRLVLRIAGYRDEELDAASDCVCTALQMTNFLQDLDVDWRRGRLYVPAEVYEPFGATEDDLKAPVLSQSWKDAVGEMASRSRRLFDEGRPVCDAVGGRLGLELRLTWLGGCRILDRLGRTGYDPRVQRPTLGLSDGAPILWKAAMWRPH
jgi:phytoene synthase